MAGTRLDGISEAYKSAIYPIIENGGPAICDISLKLHLADDEPNPFSCQITSFRLVQDPETNYADKLQLDVTTTSEIYAKIKKNENNIRATLTLVYIKDQVKYPPLILKYFAYIAGTSNNTTVPLTTRSDAAAIHESMMQVALDLHERSVIVARAKTISGILRSVTMTQVLNALVSHFEVENRVIVKSDNTNVYPQMELPAGNDLSSIFNYLHKKYGIYTGGVASYITGDVFYIYPPYTRSDQQTNNRVNIYSVRPNTLIGASTYYRETKNTLDIVCSGATTTDDTQIQDTSNNGSHAMMVLGGELMDKFVIPISTGTVRTKMDSFLSVANNKAKSLVPGVNIQSVFKAATDNAFTVMSQYTKQSNRTISVTWQGAHPFILRPGATANFIYEQDNGTHKQIKKAKGIIISVAYDSDYVNNTMAPNGRYFQFAATIVLKIEE